MIPLIYLLFPSIVATGVAVEHVQDQKLVEASKAATAAGEHELAKKLLCKSHSAKTLDECKKLEGK